MTKYKISMTVDFEPNDDKMPVDEVIEAILKNYCIEVEEIHFRVIK